MPLVVHSINLPLVMIEGTECDPKLCKVVEELAASDEAKSVFGNDDKSGVAVSKPSGFEHFVVELDLVCGDVSIFDVLSVVAEDEEPVNCSAID